jgi:hypothetical protein
MPVTVHRWALHKGLACVHTSCQTSPGRAWAPVARRRQGTQADSPALVLDMPGRLISLPIDCLSVCMPVTVHRWAPRTGLAWVHTNCQAFAWVCMGACGSALRMSTQPHRLSAVVFDAPPSDFSSTQLSECLFACDSAQMGSAKGLSLGAHQLPNVRLGGHGRLLLGVVFTPKPTPRPSCLMPCRLIPLPLHCLRICMPLTVHRWVLRKDLAWVHTSSQTSPVRALAPVARLRLNTQAGTRP